MDVDELSGIEFGAYMTKPWQKVMCARREGGGRDWKETGSDIKLYDLGSSIYMDCWSKGEDAMW